MSEAVDGLSTAGRAAVGHWDSLDQAYAAHGFPAENLQMVRRAVEAVGIDHYEGIASRTYIKAIRRGAGPALNIAHGYTDGFVSEAELIAAVGDQVHRSSTPDGRRWWVEHPTNSIREGSARLVPARDFGTCPTCGISLQHRESATSADPDGSPRPIG